MTSTGRISPRVAAHHHVASAGRRLALAAGTAAAMVFATAAGAQTFSFESPNANFITYNPSGYAGVTFNSASGVSVQGSPFFGVTPPDGTQAAFIQSSFSAGVGTISFALTGLSAGTAYTTSFFAATRPNYGIGATANGPTTPLSVSFDGTDLGAFTATSVDFTSFTALAFLATAGTGTLTFSGTAGAFGDVNLDLVNVQRSAVVTPPTPGAVPEPATWAMMLGGFGVVGFAMRRRREATGTATPA